jgi:glycerol-3-phosphate acyltransferase PlsX
MRIAIDAMGGDHGPAVMVPGALAGARSTGASLILVGQTAVIQRALDENGGFGTVEGSIIDAPETIEMDDHPAQALRRKPRSSIAISLESLRDGGVDAFVSAGNSGAVMAAALLLLGRIGGIERPAIASFLPTTSGKTLVLDLGAVTDPKPIHLVQFAKMGSAYAERVQGIPRPRVGLLSNGEEPTKGNALVREAFGLLIDTDGIDFRGNVEGTDITKGTVDVVVTDGFTGNVALKVAEGVATLVSTYLRQELTASLPRKMAALMLRRAFGSLRQKLDYSETGGAALLGVNGIVIIAHGRSDDRAIENAVVVASRAVSERVNDRIRVAMESAI